MKKIILIACLAFVAMATILVACNKDKNENKLSNLTTIDSVIATKVKVGTYNSETQTLVTNLTNSEIEQIKQGLVTEGLFESFVDVKFSLEAISGVMTPHINISGTNANGTGFDNILITTALEVVGNDVFLPNPSGGSILQSTTVKCTSQNCQGCTPKNDKTCSDCNGTNTNAICHKEVTMTYDSTWEMILKWIEKAIGIFN